MTASRRIRQRGEKRDRWKEPAEPNPEPRLERGFSFMEP